MLTEMDPSWADLAYWVSALVAGLIGGVGVSRRTKSKELAGDEIVAEYAAEQRHTTGLIGLAMRRELRPVMAEQKRQGEAIANHSLTLSLLMDETNILTRKEREHSSRLQDVEDTLS